jgi:DNA mismatch endonuclease, patch repair protein
VDIVDRATRSRMMASIKGRDTKPETILRKALHRRGLRYRLHASELPGRPDIVLPRHRAAVLVHGCFWHRHGCRLTSTPASNSDFWQAKFASTVERDARQMRQLVELGWRVATVWECALRHDGPDVVANTVAEWLASTATSIDIPNTPELQQRP